MTKRHGPLLSLFALSLLCAVNTLAQRGGGGWSTTAGDAQRSAWTRTDAKISAATLQRSGFGFLWKMKLDNQVVQLNSLTQPLILPNIISYKGFKALAYLGGSSDNVYSVDYDLAKMFWSRRLESSSVSTSSSLTCPGGLTAITRATPLVQPLPNAGRGFGPPGGGPPPTGRGGPGGASSNSNPQITNAVYVISSGGLVQVLNPQTGDDLIPPVKLLPANSKVVGSVLIDNVLYAATSDNCGGATNGVWAVDLASDARTITSWWTGGAGVAGSAGLAFSADGTLYITTADGPGGNSIVALESRTLKVKSSFAAATPFTSSPVVFQVNGRDLIAAANSDGRLYLVDASLGGPDHRTPLFKTAQYSSGFQDFKAGALATWEDSTKTRWILAPAAGPIPSATTAAVRNGAVTNGAVVAFKITEQEGKIALHTEWISRDLSSPQPPMILNDVVFAVSSGEYRTTDAQMTAAERAQRSQPAVLYALNAATGLELWNSGKTITSFTRGAGPSGADGQVYVITYDGALYAFGVPLEH